MEFYELADLLIANGADINLEIGRSDNLKNGSSSILSRNNFGGAISKAVYLLENGADPDYVCNDGRTLLITASRYGSTETVKLLLSYGADPQQAQRQAALRALQAGQFRNPPSGSWRTPRAFWRAPRMKLPNC